MSLVSGRNSWRIDTSDIGVISTASPLKEPCCRDGRRGESDFARNTPRYDLLFRRVVVLHS